MKISNAQVSLSSAHTEVKQQAVSVSIVAAQGDGGGGAIRANAREEGAFALDIGQRRFARLGLNAARITPRRARESASSQDVQLRMLEELIFLATGKRVRLGNPAEARRSGENGVTPPSFSTGGFAVTVETTEAYYEAESLNVRAMGAVRTEDGRSISFDMRLSLERFYYEEHKTSVRMELKNALDPLVINLGGGPIGLSEQKFSFDLNSDGITDNISFLTGQAGFLALDLDNDGKITGGKELFGTQSGDGFKDLAVYDEDGNGWIDENDPVFSKLKVFNMREDGSAMLISLGEAGVGALYLGAIDTDYSFKQGADMQGQMRKSSAYLKENGTAGMLHHIDLVL